MIDQDKRSPGVFLWHPEGGMQGQAIFIDWRTRPVGKDTEDGNERVDGVVLGRAGLQEKTPCLKNIHPISPREEDNFYASVERQPKSRLRSRIIAARRGHSVREMDTQLVPA